MNPWYLSDSPAVSPSCPFILYINSVLTMTVTHPPPPSSTEISKTLSSLGSSMETAVALLAHFSAVNAGGGLLLFLCFYAGYKHKDIKKRVKPHCMNKVMGCGYISKLTEWFHVEGEGQESNFRRLPGEWFYQHQRRTVVGIITSSRSKAQCVL